jgi:hypothetical protein
MLNRLYNHDRIIHNDTDRQNESKKCEGVYRKAEWYKKYECSDQRNRDSQNRNQGRSPILQK